MRERKTKIVEQMEMVKGSKFIVPGKIGVNAELLGIDYEHMAEIEFLTEEPDVLEMGEDSLELSFWVYDLKNLQGMNWHVSNKALLRKIMSMGSVKGCRIGIAGEEMFVLDPERIEAYQGEE